MKKKIWAVIVGAMFAMIGFAGCENSTDITAAFISEITSAGSDNYAVKITYGEDSRLEEKFTDVQVKFSQKGEIEIWQENSEKFTYTIEENDEWYSMTCILAQGKGEEGKEEFEPIKDVKAKTYLFSSSAAQEVTLRVVVGDVEQNFENSGQILVGTEPISTHFKLKIDKK